jgi:Holliday junction DNA helicase RuvA
VLAEAEAGDIVFLHTYLVVREEMLALYGFPNSRGKTVLSPVLGGRRRWSPPGDGNPFHAFAGQYSHRGGERTAGIFQPCAGIGKKTAQKNLIHMQGRNSAEAGYDLRKATSSAEDEVLEALVGLGYSIVEAQTAIQALPKDLPDTVEDKLRVALQYFNR